MTNFNFHITDNSIDELAGRIAKSDARRARQQAITKLAAIGEGVVPFEDLTAAANDDGTISLAKAISITTAANARAFAEDNDDASYEQLGRFVPAIQEAEANGCKTINEIVDWCNERNVRVRKSAIKRYWQRAVSIDHVGSHTVDDDEITLADTLATDISVEDTVIDSLDTRTDEDIVDGLGLTKSLRAFALAAAAGDTSGYTAQQIATYRFRIKQLTA